MEVEPDGEFTVKVVLDVTSPWNGESSRELSPQYHPNGTLDVVWYGTPTPSGSLVSRCEFLQSTSDHALFSLARHDLTCAGAPYDFGTISARAQHCGGPGPSCGGWTDTTNIAFVVTKETLGCPVPRTWGCKDGNSCRVCPAGGASVGGGPPAFGGGGDPATGPGATLRHQGSGAGEPTFPGTPAWNVELGRYWSHDYAQRIVLDPGTGTDAHVWLITETATFREFQDLVGGVYQMVSPSDEYRTLTRTAGGWELRELDGTVHAFDDDGRWLSTTDRNDNAKVGSYTAGILTSVAFPDGRREDFAYHPSGKLASITEVGVDGVSSRVWSYTWTGDDLARIDRPDATALELFYTAEGYLTRVDLLPAGGSPRRVVRAWEVDARGNVVKTWRGDPSFDGPNAVDKWQFAFDDPIRPVTTTVTDPLGNVATYVLGRDTASDKPKLVSLAGDCPACGTGPNSQLFYDDPAHPLLPSRQVDGAGHQTLMTYDARGQLITRTEAAMTALERTTEWDYDPAYPALPIQMRQPSVEGGAAERVTTWVRDPLTGDATTHRIEGFEDAAPFLYETGTSFNAAGQALSVDPPGYGTADVTGFTYDPARGDLLPLSRTDPLVGATTFAYDAFNRRTVVTDPNGVATETVYDALDRVRFVLQRGATPAEDFVTEHVYDGYGDLVRTILPRGNLLVYGYDPAGRLISIERRPDPATPAERTLYTLDGAGNRTREELQRWNATAGDWTTESATDFVYTTRCQLDRTVQAPGLPEEAATDYAYDCDGNLERVWDANHPRFEPEAPPPPPPPPDVDPLTAQPAAALAPRPGAMIETPPTQTSVYDELNRLVSVAQPWHGEGGGSAVTTYAYDVQDHLVAVTDAEGNLTTYAYSDRDLLTQEISPVSGTTAHAYNEHGELTETADARGVVTSRTVDPLDRVTFVDVPDPALDTTYTYDVPGICASTSPMGRLSAIARAGSTVDYCYDRFGRMTQDGALSYAYDRNGNRTAIGYPDGVTASYTHDFADRPATLAISVGGGPPQPVVTAADYLPGGPLAALSLGNGLAETRSFDARYVPTRIEVPGLLDAVYSTDAVGNPTAIDRTLGPDRFLATYAYQDVAYFLTDGNGPWGGESWSYDRIGNRLNAVTGSADTDAGLDEAVYHYPVNPAGGHSPQLTRIDQAAGGALDFGYDPAGDQTSVADTGPEGNLRSHLLAYDDDGRLARLQEGVNAVDFTYDGRGFLARAETPGGELRTEAVYSSEGLLHLRRHTASGAPGGGDGDDGPPPAPAATTITTWVIPFAGRPLALVERIDAAPEQLLVLTTDHLGSPLLVTDAAGAPVWQGGLTPFGGLYTLGAGTGDGGDQEPPDDGDDQDDPNEPPVPPPPELPDPGDDGRDGPPPPPGGGPPNPEPEGRDQPPPPPGGGEPNPNPDGRDDPPPGPEGRGGLRFLPDEAAGLRGVLSGGPATTTATATSTTTAATLATATAGPFLRFPGQWSDPTFEATAIPEGLYYNLHRWYQPDIGRYTRPDPLGLFGNGPNLFLYAGSSPLMNLDPLGEAFFAKRPLKRAPWLGPLSCNPIDDALNTEISHEQLFFEDGKFPSNLGFFNDGSVRPDTAPSGYRCRSRRLNDCIMRKAVAKTDTRPYCLLGNPGPQQKFNCQDWASRVRDNYSELARDPAVQDECGCDSQSSSTAARSPSTSLHPSRIICGFWGCVDSGGIK